MRAPRCSRPGRRRGAAARRSRSSRPASTACGSAGRPSGLWLGGLGALFGLLARIGCVDCWHEFATRPVSPKSAQHRLGLRPATATEAMSTAGFPATRLRRLRRTSRLRSLVRETRLDLGDFVMPLFVCPGEGVVHPLEGLPGIGQRSVDALVDETETLVALGVSAVLLFRIPEGEDEGGSGAYDEDGIVQRALRAVRARFPELVLATDVCL